MRPAVPAAVMMESVVPPPKSALSALKFAVKSAVLPTRKAMNATNVPTVAMIQNVFCQRNVVLIPEIRIRVMTMIIASPPRKIHRLSVWKLVPQSTIVWLSNSTPRPTRTGPSAKTGKNRAQKVAPIMADNAAAKFEIMASGGERMRLTQT